VKRQSAGPIKIHTRVLRPASLARAQNKTARFVWRKLRRAKSYLIADEVGAGKSYISLSLAFGLWRSQRPRKPCFRILVLAGPSELNHAWLQKLVGSVREDMRVGSLAQCAGKNSYSDLYLSKPHRGKPAHIVVYHLRYRRDVRRLFVALEDDRAKLRLLAPGRRANRVEVLVTSPSWVQRLHSQRGRQNRFWVRWLQQADVIIADEIFATKNQGTIYGRLLRPSSELNRPSLWRKRRPYLIGLSATLLSRDLSDARSVLQLCLDWRSKSRRVQSLSADLEKALEDFSRELRAGLRTRVEAQRQKHLRAYRTHKKTLEALLPKLIVRTVSHRPRSYRFEPGGHNDPRIMAPQPNLEHNAFPVDRLDTLLTTLQVRLSQARGASQDLAWFVTHAANSRTGWGDKQHQYLTWTAITESNNSAARSHVPHPKILSLLLWIKRYYAECELLWLRRDLSEPHFKLVIYVHHVKTASDLKRRSEKESPGRQLRELLRRLMLGSINRLARRNRELFRDGSLTRPQPDLSAILRYQGWSIEKLKRSNLTLLLAACVNAHKARTRDEKLRRFRETLAGSNVDWRFAHYRQTLRRLPEFRRRVLEEIGCETILDYESELKRRTGKLALTPSVALLDPDSLDLPIETKQAAQKRLGRLAKEWKFLASSFRETRERILPVLNSTARRVARLITREPAWEEMIDNFVRAPRREFNRLIQQIERPHRAPLEIAVQTGEDSGARDFTADRFRSPGNPFVLVLTNVCTVGVDLHTYCWDVLHYTPAWTPHEAEQKTGRIDRPRLRDAAQKLRISPASALKRIRVHYLIWPYTYDERILGRLNLRAQLAERLLGSKHQEALEHTPEETVVESLPYFKPLRLEPRGV
jgi:hypothetical protein